MSNITYLRRPPSLVGSEAGYEAKQEVPGSNTGPVRAFLFVC